MKKLLCFTFSFSILSSYMCNSVKQNIHQKQSSEINVSNSKNSMLNRMANYFLFFGTKDDKKYLKNLSKKFKIEELNIDWNSKKIHGYILKPKSNVYDKVCICFGSDMLPCHKMITEDIDDLILYICIDYPGFGKSEYIYMNEQKLTEFADIVYNYVYNNYKDYNLIAFGFSLGGFPASLMCNKKKIEKVILISPIYLTGMLNGLFSESVSKCLVNMLWGYELNSLKNIFECKKNCDVSLYSGDTKDFLSLYYTLSLYFRSYLKNEKDNEQKLKKIKSIVSENYKNLNLNIFIYKNCWHHQIHPLVVKKNKDLFSLKERTTISNPNVA